MTHWLISTYNYFGIGTLISILIFLFGWLLYIQRERNNRFDAFKATLLPIINILKNKKLPARSEHFQLTNEMFAEQDKSMLAIKDRLTAKRQDIFNQKWDEYKKQREHYKERSFIAYWNFADQGKNETLNLINEILKIAKHN